MHDELAARRRRKADSQAVYRAQLKADVVRAYGGKCDCCSCDDVSQLQVDHTNRDGKAHRDWLNNRSSDMLHRELRRLGYPQGVCRLLCEKCHRSASAHDDNQCHLWHPFAGEQLALPLVSSLSPTGTG